MSENQVDGDCQTIKVILLGEMGVGKTCLINSYFGKKFEPSFFTTFAPESERKVLEINQKKYLIEIWDTAGEERYRSMNNIFIKGSKVVILVYDVTNERTFSELNYWINKTKEILSNEVIYGILGNKADLIYETKISDEEGKKFAEENDALFCITSAKEDRKGFQMFIDKLVEKYIDIHFEDNIEKNNNINKVSEEKNIKKLSVKNNKKMGNCC